MGRTKIGNNSKFYLNNKIDRRPNKIWSKLVIQTSKLISQALDIILGISLNQQWILWI